MSNLKNTVYARVAAITAAEKITKVELAAVSREMLIYVPQSDDIDIVNRLISALTPVNKKVAILYFKHFLPWEEETDAKGNHVRFGKKMKLAKAITARLTLIKDWLAEESNTIWAWADDNIEVKKKDFAANIQKAIKAALKGDEKSGTEPLTHAQIVNAFFTAGLTIDDLLDGCNMEEARLNDGVNKGGEVNPIPVEEGAKGPELTPVAQAA